MKIIYNHKVIEYLNELVDILYEQNYFGFKESAYDYVDWLFDKITHDISKTPREKAPKYFNKYGRNLSFIRLKRNTQTTWYVFFHHEEDIYYIRYIGNNHVVAQHLK